jgi:hypothetical protein
MLFPSSIAVRRRIARFAKFAKQVDRVSARMNGGLFAFALALAFLVATIFIVQKLPPSPLAATAVTGYGW